MPSSTGLEDEIKDELRNDHRDQTDLVHQLQQGGFKEEEVYSALRTLMEQDEVSYNIDWDLQLEE